MTIPENKLYPRTGDKETIYLKNAIQIFGHAELGEERKTISLDFIQE